MKKYELITRSDSSLVAPEEWLMDAMSANDILEIAVQERTENSNHLGFTTAGLGWTHTKNTLKGYTIRRKG